MAEKEIAVKVEHLTKSFKIPLEASNGIKQKLINTLKGRKGYREFTPLKDISFEIEKGDFFGIVGRNGSGKSTLLKSIAGIYTPNGGHVQVNGKLVPFIELGVGFNPELTGRENVYLNGALLGFSHKEMDAMYDDIVDFAELHDFMEENLKNYSSGMQVRLAFSIAIRAKGDILLLDEILAVGDEAFQRKCYAYFAELKKENKTVILVTHSMDSVQQFCDKALLIDKNHKLVLDTPLKIAQIYRELNMEENPQTKKDQKNKNHDHQAYDCDVKYENNGEKLRFDINLAPVAPNIDKDIVFTFVISKTSGEMLYRFTSDDNMTEDVDFTKPLRISLDVDNTFPDGAYTVHVGMKKQDRSVNYALFDEIVTFEIMNGAKHQLWRLDTDYKVM